MGKTNARPGTDVTPAVEAVQWIGRCMRWARQAPPLAACALALGIALGLAPGRARADAAPFDLIGPTLEVRVTRSGHTLPIAQVPNLAAGDRVWIRADFPATQSARYLLVTAFLSGSTNPPPESWFFRCETWRKCGRSGMEFSVPQGAQQVLVFLAPATGGDFRTLVSAVRGRPGAFVRASQDLNQAMLDRSRLDEYLAAVRSIDRQDPQRLKEAAPLLARSLAIKVDTKCLDRLPELQAPCLMQGREALILDDGHSTSIVEALTSGAASDLAMQASFTPQLAGGYYSPYVASVLDIARIMSSFHTAQYQYIPALASQAGEQFVLALNTPPSFHNPKSVLVSALPAVEHVQLPPLHAVDPKAIFCASKSSLVLPVEGAPLVFSTGYAHGASLKLAGKDGKSIELPARADAEQGGFVIDTSGLQGATLGDRVRGTLEAAWGFDEYAGPSFQLVNAHAQSWSLAPKEEGTLIVGREDTIHLQAASVSCIDGIMARDPAGKELKAEWRQIKPDEVEVKLPLQEAQPGSLTLLVKQFGKTEPQPLPLQAFAEAGHLESFSLHAGDAQGLLRGSRLDEVASLSVKGISFSPGTLLAKQGGDELPMSASDPKAGEAFHAGESVTARVTLKDGRTFDLKLAVGAPRPAVALIGKSVQPSATSAQSNIQLASDDELPQDAHLMFSVRARTPAAFTREESIEVATADGAFSTVLSFANGGLTLEDARVAVASLDPARAFGSSAFGPLRFRVLVGAAQGDWQPLGTLVRLPVLRALKCPATPELACRLSGSNLFLVDSVASDAQFEHPVSVPDGFPGLTLPVPHPRSGQLFVKLRDDPAAVNVADLTTEQLPPTPDELARAAARHEAATEPHAAVTEPQASANDPRASSSAAGSATGAPPSPPLQGTQAPAASRAGSSAATRGSPAAIPGSPPAAPGSPAATGSAVSAVPPATHTGELGAPPNSL